MQLIYLVLFLGSLAFNLYALETVIMDYSDIDYGAITVYDLTDNPEKECFCFDK
jgi:hypothetical protein